MEYKCAICGEKPALETPKGLESVGVCYGCHIKAVEAKKFRYVGRAGSGKTHVGTFPSTGCGKFLKFAAQKWEFRKGYYGQPFLVWKPVSEDAIVDCVVCARQMEEKKVVMIRLGPKIEPNCLECTNDPCAYYSKRSGAVEPCSGFLPEGWEGMIYMDGWH